MGGGAFSLNLCSLEFKKENGPHTFSLVYIKGSPVFDSGFKPTYEFSFNIIINYFIKKNLVNCLGSF